MAAFDFRVCALALVLSLVTVAPVRAQSAAGDDGAAVAQSMEPISVTATRNPVNTFDYPGMVSVITRDEMSRKQPSSIGDVLQDVPGVNFSGGPRRTGQVPSIRGFDSGDVILLLDGARQNFISGHDGRLFTDPFFLREAEVVRGSSSALYGSGGTGGVMEFRTIEDRDLIAPGKRFGVEVNGGLQSVNSEWSTGVAGAARVTDTLSLTGGVVKRRSFNIETGSGAEISSSDDIISGLAKARTGWGANSLELSMQRFTNDALEPNNGQDSDATDRVDKDIRSDTQRIAYGYRPKGSSWIDLDVLAYRVDTHETERRLDNNGGGSAGDKLEQLIETLGLRVDNRSRFALADNLFSTLTYGFEAYRDTAEGRENGGARDGVPNAEQRYGAAFVQGQLEFENLWGEGTGITLLPGLRYDTYTSESSGTTENSQDEVSPKLAVQVRPIRPLMLSASYAYAFRAPTVGELYPSGTHFVISGFGTNSFVANPDLRPQTTKTFEVGAGLKFNDVLNKGDRAQIKGSHYWIKGDDFIDLVVDQPSPPSCSAPNCNGTTQSQNVDKAKLNGFEIEASYDQPRFLLNAGYAHIDGEDENTGDPLGVLTPDTLNLHAAYRILEKNMQVGWRYTHAEKFDNTTDSSLVRDAYDVHHAYLQWTADANSRFAGFAIVVGVDNIFDENYARVANDASEPGRNFKATIRYRATW